MSEEISTDSVKICRETTWGTTESNMQTSRWEWRLQVSSRAQVRKDFVQFQLAAQPPSAAPKQDLLLTTAGSSQGPDIGQLV